MKRDTYIGIETQTYEKRRIHMKKDIHTYEERQTKGTHTYNGILTKKGEYISKKRRINMKRDLLKTDKRDSYV